MDNKNSGKNGSKEDDDSLKTQKESGTWRIGLKENDTWHVDLKESDIIRRVAPKETEMWGVGKGKGKANPGNGGGSSGKADPGNSGSSGGKPGPGNGGSSNGSDLILGAAAVVGAVAVVGWGLYKIFEGPSSPTEEEKKEKMMNAPGRPGIRIPRNPFEGNPKDYFSKLHKEKKKR